MDYQGKHAIFDCTRIRTYPVNERDNKVTLSDLIDPAHIALPQGIPSSTRNSIDMVAQHIVKAHRTQRPVILFTGGHLIKNGLSMLVIDLVKRGVITHVAGNGATAIHDFELALMGQTSENVPHALGQGQFGMAY